MNRLSDVPRATRRRRGIGQALRWTLGIVAAVVALQAVFGRRDELSGAFTILEHLNVTWVIIALAAEAASVGAYAALTRRLLNSGGLPVGFAALTGITLAANAIQNSLPVGPAWSTVYSYRQFRHRGADAVLAGWVLVITSVVASATLAAIALVGLIVAQGQGAPLDLGRVIVVVTLVGAAIVIAIRTGLGARHARTLVIWVIRACQRVAHRPRGDAPALVDDAWARLASVHLSWATLFRAVGWAMCNWLLDLTCLALAFAAVRSEVPWRGLLLAYGAGQLAANLPITPGGLGVVEGSLTVALVFYGGAQEATVAAVLLYRILSFWLLLPVGWSSALMLRLRANASRSLEASPISQP